MHFLVCINVNDDVTNFLVCSFMENFSTGKKNDFTLRGMLCQKIIL